MQGQRTKNMGHSLSWCCLRRWQPSPWHHGHPQTSHEAKDNQKEDQEVHLTPVRPICQNYMELAETQGH